MGLLVAGLVLLGIMAIFAGLLGYAKVKLHVEEDPRIGQINDILPAANCGGCGYAGCVDFAKAVVEGRAPCDGCTVGGPKVAETVARMLGKEVVQTWPFRPVIHCRATREDKHGVVDYDGVMSCVEANVVGVTQACTYGCLGFGDCARACDFDALHMIDGKPVVDYDKCVGCGACAAACPRDLIEQIPFKQEQMMVVACNNKEPGKNVKQVCKVGCIGCKACQRVLADLFQIDNNLAHIDYDNYAAEAGEQDLDAAAAKCPAKSIIYFGKPKPQYAEQLAQAEAETNS